VGFQLPLLQIGTQVERNGSTAVVFTGYHGGIVWGLNADESYGTSDLRRRDLSGLDLSELRLKSGFINVAVPFIFARSTPSIRAVSRSAQMSPWRMHNDYDRPIARRIVESAGVARAAFGTKKVGLFGGSVRPMHAGLRERYAAYLRDAYRMGRGRLFARLAFDRITGVSLHKTAHAMPDKPPFAPLRNALLRRFRRLVDGESMLGGVNLRLALYAWSVDELAREIAGGDGAAQSGSASPRRASSSGEPRPLGAASTGVGGGSATVGAAGGG
jgi:hypothetical protein